MSLGAIFHDMESVGGRKRLEGIHVRGVSIEMDGKEGTGLGGDLRGRIVRIQTRRAGVHVHEDGPGPCVRHSGGGGDEGEGGNQDFVSRADVQGAKGQEEGRRPALDRDAMGRSVSFCEVPFETINGRAPNKGSLFQERKDRLSQFGEEGAMFAGQVDERDSMRSHGLDWEEDGRGGTVEKRRGAK